MNRILPCLLVAASLFSCAPKPNGNTWGDTCWGVDLRTGQGENHLGRILMKVREELAGSGQERN